MHVDDDPSSLEISKQILMDMGNFEIDYACCVEEAFKKLAAGNFDVVVSDYEMPKKDGLQFLLELRKSKNEIPFILFTGKGREEVAVKALNLGADGYINKQGNPETVYGELKHVILNSFEKRIAQEMLRQSEERFKNLVTNSKDLIMLTQADGVVLFLSPSCKNVLGYEPSELVGKIPWIIHADDLERVQKVFQSALTSKLSETLEYRILTKQGETKWVNHTFSQLWENGELKQIVSNLTDITESKKAEEAITQSESHYRLLGDNVHDVIWTMDLEGHFTYVSPSVLQLSGYTSDDVLKQSMVEALTPDSARIVLEDLQRFWETGAVPSNYYELEQYCKNGSTVWTEVNFTVLRNRDGKPKAFLGVSRNIAERKKVESEMKREREALRESEERFRTIFEGASEGILVADVKKKSFVFANFAMCELSGYSLKELLLMGVDDIHPREDLPYAAGDSAKQTKGKAILATDIPVLRKDGKVVYCDVTSKVSRFGNQECLVGFFRDTSERKKTEEKLRESIHNNELICEKLRVVGGLTRHDVGNKLMAAKSNLYLLKKQLDNRPELAKYLDGIDSALASSDRIFEFSGLYEKIGAEKPSKENVAQCFCQAEALLPNLSTVKVVNDCKGLDVVADSLLKQLFYNFLDNSLKHGERVTQIRLHYTKEGDELNLFYEDDGVGIPEANKSKLFDVGFTTGKGNGLGLYLIKKMMNVYGWTITEKGETGKGAKFTITIPKLNKRGKENFQTA